jgi:hypothetical protein
MSKACAAFILGIAFFLSAQLAQALDFDFTFAGTTEADAPGTVSGEIFGLTDNTTSLPTNVKVTVDTQGFSTPFSFAPYAGDDGPGFTVTAGVITSAVAGFTDSTSTRLITFDDEENYYGTYTQSTFTANDLGFAGVTYTPDFNDIPEVSTWAMLFLGLCAVGFFVPRKLA